MQFWHLSAIGLIKKLHVVISGYEMADQDPTVHSIGKLVSQGFIKSFYLVQIKSNVLNICIFVEKIC